MSSTRPTPSPTQHQEIRKKLFKKYSFQDLYNIPFDGLDPSKYSFRSVMENYEAFRTCENIWNMLAKSIKMEIHVPLDPCAEIDVQHYYCGLMPTEETEPVVEAVFFIASQLKNGCYNGFGFFRANLTIHERELTSWSPAVFFRNKDFSERIAILHEKPKEKTTGRSVGMDVTILHLLEVQFENPPPVGKAWLKSLSLTPLLLRCEIPFPCWEPMGLLGIDRSWWPVLIEEFKQPYFKKLCWFVKNERATQTVYPSEPHDTFAWTRYCRPEDVKVVIVGQDPYYSDDKACGLAFSQKDLQLPPLDSLNSIFGALESDAKENEFPFQRPEHGNLTGWAKQGVLLLNKVLTVRERDPFSHGRLRYKEDDGKVKDFRWQKITTAVINYISCRNDGVVFLLWGNEARKTKKDIECHNHYVHAKCGTMALRHLVLESYHPVYNGSGDIPEEQLVEEDPTVSNKSAQPLYNSYHFSKANSFLMLHHGKGIDWNDLPNRAYE